MSFWFMSASFFTPSWQTFTYNMKAFPPCPIHCIYLLNGMPITICTSLHFSINLENWESQLTSTILLTMLIKPFQCMTCPHVRDDISIVPLILCPNLHSPYLYPSSLVWKFQWHFENVKKKFMRNNNNLIFLLSHPTLCSHTFSSGSSSWYILNSTCMSSITLKENVLAPYLTLSPSSIDIS